MATVRARFAFSAMCHTHLQLIHIASLLRRRHG
jgi:hypothetical protein